MKTVPWEMPWTPSLNIRFSDHTSGEKVNKRELPTRLRSYYLSRFRGIPNLFVFGLSLSNQWLCTGKTGTSVHLSRALSIN